MKEKITVTVKPGIEIDLTEKQIQEVKKKQHKIDEAHKHKAQDFFISLLSSFDASYIDGSMYMVNWMRASIGKPPAFMIKGESIYGSFVQHVTRGGFTVVSYEVIHEAIIYAANKIGFTDVTTVCDCDDDELFEVHSKYVHDLKLQKLEQDKKRILR